MDRTAVFVDAGYLFACGSVLISGERLARCELQLEHEAVLDLFSRIARELTGLPLLRIYWYDGAAAGPTLQQLALAYWPNVKLRLGSLNQQGQQKGVDALIVTDLINLARHRAMADAVLVTGDEDIRVGVQQAQELGVRVHLVGIEPARENQSGLLAQEADALREISLAELAPCLKRAALLAPAGGRAGGSGVPDGGLESVAGRVAAELDAEQRAVMLAEAGAGSLPADVDRKLLIAATQAAGGVPLSADQKRSLRALFLAASRKLARQ
jgi:uncharacterized LabA/DUF88 family protein